MTAQVIPAEAVEAAAWGIYQESFPGHSATRLDQVGGPIRDECLRKARAALEAAAPHMLAGAWEDAYSLGYADCKAGAGPVRTNPHKAIPATPVTPATTVEHELARTQLAPPVCVWCKCGAEFDAFGDKGAMNKLNDHIMLELARTPDAR